MSGFALESVQLLDNHEVSKFILNVIGNVGLSIGALILARNITVMLMRIWENVRLNDTENVKSYNKNQK